MMTSLVDAESVLAIDVGSVNTRALLFDVVDGNYRFIAMGMAPSTIGAPFRDVGEGFFQAVKRLQEATGRTLIDRESSLILPAQSDAAGVDKMVVSFSAGDDLNLVTMGLLADVSLESAERLAATTYGRVVDRIGLTDTRRGEVQIDALIKARPDVVIVAGGTEKGATRSVFKQVELITLALKVLPRENRPMVIYCGNPALEKRVKEALDRETVVGIAPNIRPSIDIEDLDPAVMMLAKATSRLRSKQVGGFAELASLSGSPLVPGAYAFGRIIRFLSAVENSPKGVLGVDLGSSGTVLAAAQAGVLSLSVLRSVGMGTSLQSLLQMGRLEDLARWIPYPLPLAEVRDYLYQKSLHPASLPLTNETLAIEQAAARYSLEIATQRLLERYPGLALNFDPVILSGSTLSQAPRLDQALLMVLDGVQPVGISTFLLDPYGLTQSLGAVAASNTVLPAQVLGSGIYTNLGTVIAPICSARPGTTILNIHVTPEGGAKSEIQVKQGTLVTLPVGNGQKASLAIEAMHGAVLDPRRPRLKSFRVTGGICGVVVDARGRPLALPADGAKRIEMLNYWSHAVEDRRAG